MNRSEALNFVRANVRNYNLIKHMLATEAIMRALAKRFGEDEEEWGLTGLLHDMDIELIGDNFAEHGRRGADLAAEEGVSPEVCHAIMCHNWTNEIQCVALLDKALICTDPLTGLITAGALIRPDRKLGGSPLNRCSGASARNASPRELTEITLLLARKWGSNWKSSLASDWKR